MKITDWIHWAHCHSTCLQQGCQRPGENTSLSAFCPHGHLYSTYWFHRGSCWFCAYLCGGHCCFTSWPWQGCHHSACSLRRPSLHHLNLVEMSSLCLYPSRWTSSLRHLALLRTLSLCHLISQKTLSLCCLLSYYIITPPLDILRLVVQDILPVPVIMFQGFSSQWASASCTCFFIFPHVFLLLFWLYFLLPSWIPPSCSIYYLCPLCLIFS